MALYLTADITLALRRYLALAKRGKTIAIEFAQRLLFMWTIFLVSGSGLAHRSLVFGIDLGIFGG